MIYKSVTVPVSDPDKFKTSSIPKERANSAKVRSVPSVPSVTLPPILKLNLSAPLIVITLSSSNVKRAASFVQRVLITFVLAAIWTVLVPLVSIISIVLSFGNKLETK